MLFCLCLFHTFISCSLFFVVCVCILRCFCYQPLVCTLRKLVNKTKLNGNELFLLRTNCTVETSRSSDNQFLEFYEIRNSTNCCKFSPHVPLPCFIKPNPLIPLPVFHLLLLLLMTFIFSDIFSIPREKGYYLHM